MALFGLTDPWIIGGYVLSFVSVIFCCAYAIVKGVKAEDETDE